MSRPKAPSERLRNGDGKEASNELTPAEFDRPDLPEDLVDVEGAAELWAEVWDFGGAQYRPQFRFVIERYVGWLIEREHLLGELGGPTGQRTFNRDNYGPVLHPNARRLDTIEKNMATAEKELGLTPEAAARLGMAAKEASELEDFING